MTLLLTKCGGEGSGVPGPCPSSHHEMWHSVGIRLASQHQLDSLEKAKNADRDKYGVMQTKGKVELVSIQHLIATQKRLSESVVESYRGKPIPDLGKDKGQIIGIRHGGNVYIDDGHHRIFAGAKDGVKIFKMEVIDLDTKRKLIRAKLKMTKLVVRSVTQLLKIREKKLTTQFIRDRAIRVHDAQAKNLEDKLVPALAPLFKKQIEDAASKLKSSGSIEGVFNPRDYDEELINRALPPIAQAMAGAMMSQALQMHSDLKNQIKKKNVHCEHCGHEHYASSPCENLRYKASTASEWLDSLDGDDEPDLEDVIFHTPYGNVSMKLATDYPEWMKDKIQERLDETFSQPYWKEINDTTKGTIDGFLSRSLKDGLSIEEMAKQMSEEYGADYPKSRGRNIARTEAGNALNGARSDAIDGLIKDLGLEESVKKIWLSILGNTTRDAHAHLHLVPADKEGRWYLNGIACRWPGDITLGPGDRCNCQCTVSTSYGMLDDEAEEKIADYQLRVQKFFELKCGGPGSGVPGPCPSAPSLSNLSSAFHEYVRTRNQKVLYRSAMNQIEKEYPPSNPKGHDTESKYRKFDGTYTKEREALHNKIIAEALSKSTPTEHPVSYMMGGGSGSGKSSAQKNMAFPKNLVHIDTDELKIKLPEYQKMLEFKDSRAAAHTHYETAHIAKRILSEAVSKSYNVMLDGTGNTSLHSVMKRINTMNKGGRKIIATYVTCDVKTAMKRNISRAKETGRLTPEHILKENHRSVSQLVPELIKAGVFHSFNLFDTSSGSTVHVASAEGSNLKIHNKGLWNEFLKKGEYHHQHFQGKLM